MTAQYGNTVVAVGRVWWQSHTRNTRDLVLAQAVSRKPLTAEAWDRSQVHLRFVVYKVTPGDVFRPLLQFSPVNITPLTVQVTFFTRHFSFPQSSSLHWRYKSCLIPRRNAAFPTRSTFCRHAAFQTKLSLQSPHRQSSQFPSMQPSLLGVLDCFHPTFTWRTSGDCLEIYTAVNLLSSLYWKIIELN